MHELLATPWRGSRANGALIKRELKRCVELKRALVQAGRFN
jgi:hypothetical protein